MASGRVFRRKVNGVQQKTWTAQYDAPPDATGKRKQKMKSGFRTKGEAQAFLVETQTEINNGSYIEPSNMTFEQYFEYWLENYAKHNLKITTFTQTEIKVKSAIKRYPILSTLRLPDLKPLHFQQIINGELDRGLKISTVKTLYAMLRNPLNQAVEWELISKNPMDSVNIPKLPKSQVKSLNPGHVNLLLELTKGKRLHDLYYLAVVTGLRRGELLGLLWKNIDLEEGIIHIRRTSNYINGQGIVALEGAKTDNSVRTIAISEAAVALLRNLKVKQSKEKLAVGSAYANTDGLVFAKKDGTPIYPLFVSEHFKKMMRRLDELHLKKTGETLGLEKFNFHCLRHTHATFLLAQGENPKLIAERLGHSNAAITLNTYSHVLPNAQKQAADRLDVFLRSEGVQA